MRRGSIVRLVSHALILTCTHSFYAALFMSKEGGAKVVMKVGVLDIVGGANEESYNFTFVLRVGCC